MESHLVQLPCLFRGVILDLWLANRALGGRVECQAASTEATRLITSGRWLQRRQEQVIGMRNKVIHDYGGLALDILWQVAR